MKALDILSTELTKADRLILSMSGELDDARRTIARLERQHERDLELIREQRDLLEAPWKETSDA